MPTKPLDRLLFAQGGTCFFCKEEIPKQEASVEHLVAVTHGGNNNDENCVVCCKTLNMLFGRMSLKEKIQIILNQKGKFICPASLPKELLIKNDSPAHDTDIDLNSIEINPYDLILENLQKRGTSRPGKPDKLLNTIRSTLISQNKDPMLAEKINKNLQKSGYVTIKESKVIYNLPKMTH